MFDVKSLLSGNAGIPKALIRRTLVGIVLFISITGASIGVSDSLPSQTGIIDIRDSHTVEPVVIYDSAQVYNHVDSASEIVEVNRIEPFLSDRGDTLVNTLTTGDFLGKDKANNPSDTGIDVDMLTALAALAAAIVAIISAIIAGVQISLLTKPSVVIICRPPRDAKFLTEWSNSSNVHAKALVRATIVVDGNLLNMPDKDHYGGKRIWGFPSLGSLSKGAYGHLNFGAILKHNPVLKLASGKEEKLSDNIYEVCRDHSVVVTLQVIAINYWHHRFRFLLKKYQQPVGQWYWNEESGSWILEVSPTHYDVHAKPKIFAIKVFKPDIYDLEGDIYSPTFSPYQFLYLLGMIPRFVKNSALKLLARTNNSNRPSQRLQPTGKRRRKAK